MAERSEPILPGFARRDALLLLAVAIVLTVSFLPVFSGWAPYQRDLTRYHYPMKHVVHEIVRDGEFPWWNPYFSAGQPLAANPAYELFYPPQWLIFLEDFHLGYRLHILIHLYIAALGMFLLARSMRLSSEAAAFAALTFSLGGYILSATELLPFLFSASWLPLVVLTTRAAALDPRPRRLSMAALAGGMQALVGEPTTLVQTWVIVTIIAIHASRSESRLRLLRALGIVTMCGLGAVAVAAVQLLPAIDHAGDSIRSQPFDWPTVSRWSFPPLRTIEFLFPRILGSLEMNGDLFWGGRAYPGAGYPLLVRIYLGLAAAILCLTGLTLRVRYRALFASGAALSLLASFGSHTPLLSLAHGSGLLPSVRYPEKFILTTVFAAVVFAAVIFDRLDDPSVRRRVAFLTATLAAIAVAVALLAASPAFPGWFSTATGERLPAMVSAARAAALSAAVTAVLLTALLLIGMRRPQILPILLLTFAAGDLALRVGEVVPLAPPQFFTAPPLPAELPAARGSGRLFHQADWYGAAPVSQKYRAEGRFRYWVFRNGLFPLSPAVWQIETALDRDYDMTFLLPTHELVKTMWRVKERGRSDWAELFMAMTNSWYRAVFRPFEQESVRSGGDAERMIPIHLVAGERTPRFFFAKRVVYVNGVEAAQFLSTVDRSEPFAMIDGNAFTPASGEVLSVAQTSSTVSLDVVSQGESLLVAIVTRHKYWTVKVDGRRVKPVAANIAFQAVRLPQGRHLVEFRYRNPLVVVGGVVSLLATLGALLIVAWRPNRSAPV
jgi:hypothetical protein